jgi:peptide/nickel transport system permease protein
MERPLESPDLAVTPVRAPTNRRLQWRFLRILRKSPAALLGTILLTFWVILAIFGPVLVPYGMNDIDSGQVWKLPSAAHPLGTDDLGRDIFSRLVIGAGQVILLPTVAVAIAVFAGTSLGLLTGYHGGWFDEIVMRIMDVWMAFPVVMLYLLIIVALGASAVNVVIAVAVATAPAIARMVRGLALDMRNREFVAAARMRGESTSYILFREILPNMSGPILVDALVRVGYSVFSVAALGFLGLGVPPPNPDWGRMTFEGRQAMAITPTAALFPALAIASLVIAFNLLADGLREAAKAEE